MDKGLLIFLTIGVISIYFITNFVGEIQRDSEKQTGTYQKKRDKQYYSTNIVGDTILDVHNLEVKKQLEIWNNSELKQEFMELFPNFDAMKRYVNDKIVGDALQEKLLKRIDDVEIQFISGTLNGEQSKSKLNAI